MRLSELKGKEVINLTDGSRWGICLRPEADVDLEQGRIVSLVFPAKGGWLHPAGETVVPWPDIRRISQDVILVETEARRHSG